MTSLTDKELMNINGGGLNFSILAGIAVCIATGITFIVGVIDGIVRPLKCSE